MKKTLVIAITTASLFACSSKKKPAALSGAGSSTSVSGSDSASAGLVAAASAATNGAIWTDKPDPLQQAVLAATAENLLGAGKKDPSLVGRIIDATAAAHAAVSRDAWDPAAVIATVGKDRAALFKWVRDNTALVPYRGSLRGAVGVMMDRIGNSFDRSLLLADLLTKAGLEVRLANAQLDPALVAKLVATTRTRARPAVSTAHIDDAALLATLSKLTGVDAKVLDASGAKQQAAFDALAARTKSRVDTEAKALAALVPAAGAPASTDDAFADHWWVQVHDGDAWSNLDPSLPTAAPGEALAAVATDTIAPGDITDDRRHTVAIRVIGEVWHGDTREESVLLDYAFAPSQFFGQRITVSNIALDMPDAKTIANAKDPLGAARTAMLAQNEFAPMIRIGSKPLLHFSVNDRGELTDLMNGDGNTIRLARAVQHATKDGVGGATGMLDQLPGESTDGPGSAAPPSPPPATPAFTAEWLEIEIRTPGAAPQITRRTIFDTLGPVADRNAARPVALPDAARFDRALALNAETELLPLFAQIPRAFVIDRTVQAMTSMKEVLTALAAHKNLDAEWDKLAGIVSAPGPIYSLALARFDDPAIYLDRLDVLTVRQRVIARDKAFALRKEVDILANATAVWPTTKGARSARIAQGVRDTDLEMLAAPCTSCLRAPTTAELFETAKDWSVVATPSGPAAVDRTAGYAIVAPTHDGASPRTWWRIDPATGETLGMNPRGGDTMTEEAALNASMIDNAIGSIANLVSCFYELRNPLPIDNEGNGFAQCMFATGVGFIGGTYGGFLSNMGGSPAGARAVMVVAQLLSAVAGHI